MLRLTNNKKVHILQYQKLTSERKMPTKTEKEYSTKIKNISWKFQDASIAYPEVKNIKNKKIHSPEDIYSMFKFLFENETQELFCAIWLNSANNVIGYEVVTKGILNSTTIHVREVFRSAIVASCANIILAHNHPSGNLDPSNEDISTTRKFIEAGKIIDINVFDHIIFANNGYTSFVEKHLI